MMGLYRLTEIPMDGLWAEELAPGSFIVRTDAERNVAGIMVPVVDEVRPAELAPCGCGRTAYWCRCR